MNTENITVYNDPDIINSQVYIDVYNTVVKAGHGVGDAMAGYAKATGIEAVTMERRLFNFQLGGFINGDV